MQGAGEGSVAAFTDSITAFLGVEASFRMTRDGNAVIVNVDVYVFFL